MAAGSGAANPCDAAACKHGSCIAEGSNFRCDCGDSGFAGMHCEEDTFRHCGADNAGCEQRCSLQQNAPVCACEPGATLKPDGKHCRHWHTPVALETHERWFGLHVAATQPSGVTQLVWGGFTATDTASHLRSAKYVPESGWSMPAPFAPLDNGQDRLFMGANRDTALLLEYRENGTLSAYSRSGDAWSAPVVLFSMQTSRQESAALAVSDDGSAWAVFVRDITPDNPTRTGVFGARYTAAAGWSNVEQIDRDAPDNMANVSTPAIVALPGGGALLFWLDYLSRGFAKVFSPATGWSASTLLRPQRTDLDHGAGEARLVADEKGNALATWLEYAKGSSQLVSKPYSAAGNWGAQEVVASIDGTTLNYATAARRGQVFFLTQDKVGTDRTHIAFRTFAFASGWGESKAISGDFPALGLPGIAVDADGNAIVAWSQPDASRNLWSRHLPFGSDWSDPIPINADNAAVALIGLGIDASGRCTATWTSGPKLNQDDSRIWANTFD